MAIRIGELSTSLNLFNNAIEEYIPSSGINESGSLISIEYLVQNWDTDKATNQIGSQQIMSIRKPLLGIIPFFYILFILTLTKPALSLKLSKFQLIQIVNKYFNK